MKQKCLVEECNKTGVFRGLCHDDYRSALRLVKSGKITWEKLEDNNLAKKSIGKNKKLQANSTKLTQQIYEKGIL